MSPMQLTPEFRPIPGWPGYFVRNDGTIASMRLCRGDKVRILKQSRDHGGYYHVGPVRDGKQENLYVHKVVMLVFGPPRPSPQHIIRHWDDVKANNHISNLLWGTNLDNTQDAVRNGCYAGERNGRAKLTRAQVDEIRQSPESGAALGRKFGVTKEAVYFARKRITWAD